MTSITYPAITNLPINLNYSYLTINIPVYPAPYTFLLRLQDLLHTLLDLKLHIPILRNPLLMSVQLAAEDLAELVEEPLELLDVGLEGDVLHEDVSLVG